MSVARMKNLIFLTSFSSLIALLFIRAPHIIAQTPPELNLKSVPCEFVSEPGCPVTILSASTHLELDPFGAPLAARLYIEYKNTGDKPVSAVKFRIRFTDETSKDLGTFHASHDAKVGTGAISSEKWRHEKVNPRTSQVKIRVLVVRYSQDFIWQSSKIQQVVTPAQDSSPP